VSSYLYSGTTVSIITSVRTRFRVPPSSANKESVLRVVRLCRKFLSKYSTVLQVQVTIWVTKSFRSPFSFGYASARVSPRVVSDLSVLNSPDVLLPAQYRSQKIYCAFCERSWCRHRLMWKNFRKSTGDLEWDSLENKLSRTPASHYIYNSDQIPTPLFQLRSNLAETSSHQSPDEMLSGKAIRFPDRNFQFQLVQSPKWSSLD
jgi:hypothetical protein